MMKLFDAHCHLQDERLELEKAMDRAHGSGVMEFACCGTQPTDWPIVSGIAQRHEGVFPSYGVHPWFQERLDSQWLEQLALHLKENPCGVGEIGLDHGIKNRDDERQERIFLAQMKMSRDLRKPVSIHCRRAWGRMLELLTPLGTHPKGMVIHSYSGSHELVEPLRQLGVFFSFSGTLTYHRNKRAHKAALTVPLDRLLLETDAPDMLPVLPNMDEETRRRTPNEPANLVWVLQKAAALRGISESEMAEITWANARRLFYD